MVYILFNLIIAVLCEAISSCQLLLHDNNECIDIFM